MAWLMQLCGYATLIAFLSPSDQEALHQPPGLSQRRPESGGIEGTPVRVIPWLWPSTLSLSQRGVRPQLHILSLQAQLTDLLSEQRAKALRLQAELETSEQVQRDFVRLSQALQVCPGLSYLVGLAMGNLSWVSQG